MHQSVANAMQSSSIYIFSFSLYCSLIIFYMKYFVVASLHCWLVYTNVTKLFNIILNICSDWHLSDLYLDESIERPILVVTAFQKVDSFKCTLTWMSDNAVKIYSCHEYGIHFGKLKMKATFKRTPNVWIIKRIIKNIWRDKSLESISKFEMPLQLFL